MCSRTACPIRTTSRYSGRTSPSIGCWSGRRTPTRHAGSPRPRRWPSSSPGYCGRSSRCRRAGRGPRSSTLFGPEAAGHRYPVVRRAGRGGVAARGARAARPAATRPRGALSAARPRTAALRPAGRRTAGWQTTGRRLRTTRWFPPTASGTRRWVRPNVRSSSRDQPRTRRRLRRSTRRCGVARRPGRDSAAAATGARCATSRSPPAVPRRSRYRRHRPGASRAAGRPERPQRRFPGRASGLRAHRAGRRPGGGARRIARSSGCARSAPGWTTGTLPAPRGAHAGAGGRTPAGLAGGVVPRAGRAGQPVTTGRRRWPSTRSTTRSPASPRPSWRWASAPRCCGQLGQRRRVLPAGVGRPTRATSAPPSAWPGCCWPPVTGRRGAGRWSRCRSRRSTTRRRGSRRSGEAARTRSPPSRCWTTCGPPRLQVEALQRQGLDCRLARAVVHRGTGQRTGLGTLPCRGPGDARGRTRPHRRPRLLGQPT